jgi:hypothetical protein
MIKLNKIYIFLGILYWCPQVYMNSMNMINNNNNKSNLGIFKVMKSTSETKFGHYLLSTTLNDNFEDLILMSCIWVPNTTKEGTMKKKVNLNNTLLLLLAVWPNKLRFYNIRAFFTYTWPCLLPRIQWYATGCSTKCYFSWKVSLSTQ